MACRDIPYQMAAFWADTELALLRERFPGWYLWYVLCYPNSVSWCAMPLGQQIATLHGNTPAELAEYIEATEAGED